MEFEEVMRKLARRAEAATKLGMNKLKTGRIKHEDDLTPALVQSIEERINGYKIGGVKWDASILTHRRGGEEGQYGADILIHVELKTPQYKYSKGVLIQAKRAAPASNLSKQAHADLMSQCGKMLSCSAASFVFAYDSHGLRAASATKIQGANDRALYDQCSWTSYRFFLELFRCPIGDPNIKSADVKKLSRYGVLISGSGDLDADRLEEIED